MRRKIRSAPNQCKLFSGMDCLPGQLDLFPTDDDSVIEWQSERLRARAMSSIRNIEFDTTRISRKLA